MESQSIRWHDKFPEWAGMSRRHHYTVWLGGGDWGHTMLCPWLEYYHATGYYPAWEMAQHTAATMANIYEGSWRYISNPLIGNARMYLETGDDKYKAVADRIWKDLCAPDRNRWYAGSHGSRVATWYSQINEECKKSWEQWARDGRGESDRKTREFQDADSLGMLGHLTGAPYFAHQARLSFDSSRSQTLGVNPVYRGLVPTITQYLMGSVRTVCHAAEQIAKSKRLFPAKYYRLGYVREVVMREDTDSDFVIWMNRRTPDAPKVVGPDGKPANVEVETVFARDEKRSPICFLKVTVKADGKTGFHQLPQPVRPTYFGCSLKHVAIRLRETLNEGTGDPLYVRSDDIGAPKARILMTGTPVTSLEIFALDGERLFSKTYVRPAQDAMGVEHTIALPKGAILRLGDCKGIRFMCSDRVPVYTDPEGGCELP